MVFPKDIKQIHMKKPRAKSLGQSMAEYALIVTLIALVCAVGFGNLGASINQSLVDVTASVGVLGEDEPW
jgi:Flp pilus assembly pilin Flp